MDTTAAGVPLYVVLIEYDGQRAITVHSTQEKAEGEIAAFCRRNWYAAWPDPDQAVPPIPDDDKEAIRTYFAAMADECDGDYFHLYRRVPDAPIQEYWRNVDVELEV